MTEKGIWGTGIAALAAIALFCIWHHKPTDLPAAPAKVSATAVDAAPKAPPVTTAVPAAVAPAVVSPTVVSPTPPAAVEAAPVVTTAPAVGTMRPPEVVKPELSVIKKTPKAVVRKAINKRVYSNTARKGSTLKAKRLAKARLYKQTARGCDVAGERSGANVIRSICFNFNSAKLSASSKAKLTAIVPNLKADAKSYELSGFTDSIGPKDYNNNLAERRAQAVKRFLESKGVESAKVTVKSYGSERSDSGSGKTSKSLDRRVDVRAL